jgi:hypothetical protein
MLSKTKAILSGLKNYVFPTPESEKIAVERANVCGGCEYNVNDKCSLCGGCFLVLKVRSKNNGCPLQKWER